MVAILFLQTIYLLFNLLIKAQKVAPLFSHLHQYERETAVTNELPLTGGNIHPSIVSLGLQVKKNI